MQFLPLFRGSGAIHSLFLCRLPSPQEDEQSVNEVHSDQPPSTLKARRNIYINNFNITFLIMPIAKLDWCFVTTVQ